MKLLKFFDKSGESKPATVDKAGLHGTITFRQKRDGKIILERTVRNIVTAAGKAAVAGLINAVGSTQFTHLAIGTDNTTITAGDTNLGGEITTNGGERATATCTQVTTDDTNDTAQLVHEWTFTGSFTVQEAGVFSSTTAGTMLAATTFSAINVGSGDSLEVTYKIDVD